MFFRISRLTIFLFLSGFVSTVQAATYVVDRNDDVAGASACTAAANDCSLRGAINNANANGTGADTIQFNIGGGNPQTITLSAALPFIQTSLTIDGTTQPLFGGLPLIEINGLNAGAGADGFYFATPSMPLNITIKSLVINRFQGNGIYINTAGESNVTIVGCYIGTSMNGASDLGNGQHGIRLNAIWDSTYNIGGTLTSERNVISGNNGDGIHIDTSFTFTSPNQTQINVLNNFIGTTSAGNADLGNSGRGIFYGGSGFGYTLLVGNGLGNGRNIISGNDQEGIRANYNTILIMGNYIGTSLNGNTDLGNALSGIRLDYQVRATVGGTILGINTGNVISGNDYMGIEITDADVEAVIQRNRIGTNAAGTAALGNSEDGINLWESDQFTDADVKIGSETDAADGNTISGNGGDGINISEKVRKVKVYANLIGTNSAATAALPNALAGIRILSAQNEIGLAGSDMASNVISGNSGSGIMLVSSTSAGNKVFNNFIGTNAGGANLGNSGNGIYINQSAYGNQVGTGLASGSNRIAFNGGNGVDVADGSLNAVRANSIYSNGELGIELGATGVTLNDPGDLDSGPNSLQNFPVIQRATPTLITGFLDSFPGEDFAVDFYRVDSCDASGYGEGRYYLGSQTVLTSAQNGIAQISFPASLTAGQFVTATATFTNAGAGDTSEFSQCVAVTPEPGNLSFSASAYTVNESSGTRTIVVNRSGGSFGAISVNYTTSDGTAIAGQDYTANSGTLNFANGEVVKTFDIPINNDLLDETDETINLTLSNPPPGVFLTPNPTSVLTIIDNDAPPNISIEDVTHGEGNLGAAQFSFRVSLSAPSGLPVSVDFITANGTATASSDYAATNGTVNFAPGETLKNILVTVIGDLTPELDETFFVNLSNPTNANFGDNQALGTILDDDNPGKFSFSFAPYSGTEHDSVQITVSRTNGTAGTVSVDYATQGGTATPFDDYTPVAGTLIFADGETTKTFNVSLADDLIPEPAETVNLVLSNPIGGTVLGTPSTAVLNIIDNDNGTLLTLAGEIVSSVDHSPVANVSVALQGTQNAVTTTDSQGRFSFANLAPNGNYTVTPSAIGYTFNPINQQFDNLSADNFNVNFTATQAPSRQLRLVGGNAAPGQNVQVVAELVAQGDENSIGFSVNYDSAVLTNPNVVLNADAANAFLTVNNSTNGKLGILLALPAGQSFSVGTKSLVTITFNTLPTNSHNSPVTFGNVPISKQIVNTNADPLPANYLDGAVTFAQGWEADVAPRPTGNNNGSITIADFTQVGRFVAGLDAMNDNFNEFQRADCAPRISLGNGQLTVSDYTQAGRYAAGLDVVNPAGGMAFQSFLPEVFGGKEIKKTDFVPTVVRVVNAQGSPGTQIFVSIETDATGTENGFGFTLNYDAAKLLNPLVSKGADTQTATLIPNTTQAGKVGVVLAMPFGTAIQAGTRQLVTVRFDIAANAAAGQTPLTFGDSPVFREVVDADANTLKSTFNDGNINVLGPTAANVNVSGRVTTTSGRGIFQAVITMIDSNGATRTARTNPFGYYNFAEVEPGRTYIFSAAHKSFQFNAPQAVTVLEEIANMNFVAQNSP